VVCGMLLVGCKIRELSVRSVKICESSLRNDKSCMFSPHAKWLSEVPPCNLPQA